MAESLNAPMPPGMDVPDGYQFVWAAIDATTGADVGGVVVQNVSIYGRMLGMGQDGELVPLGPFMLVPGPGA